MVNIYCLIVSQQHSCIIHCMMNFKKYSSILFSPIGIGSVAIIIFYDAAFRGYSRATWNYSNKICHIFYYITSISHRYQPKFSGVGDILVIASHANVLSVGDFMIQCRDSRVRSLMRAKSMSPTVLYQGGFIMTCSSTISILSLL